MDETQRMLEAIRTSDWEELAAAIEAGADVDALQHGLPALVLAANSGKVAPVDALLDAGANVGARVRRDMGERETVLHAWARFQTSERLLKRLLAHGCEIDAQNELEQTPLFVAIERETDEPLRLLLDSGASITCRDFDGNTPLHHACTPVAYAGDRSLRPSLVRKASMLIAAGADVNAVAEIDVTPLHLAAMWGSDAMVRLLLDSGSDPDQRNGLGETAADVAASEDLRRMLR